MKPIHPKVKATGGAGAVVIIGLWAAGLIPFDQAVVDAMTLLVAVFGGWLKTA